MKTPPESPRLALAATLAKKLLAREQILEPPVPATELLEQFASIHPLFSQTEQCFFLEYDRIWQVYITPNFSTQKLNFTEAHILGHLFLNHLDFDPRALTREQYQVLDLEADHFANNLIMPESWLRAACANPNANDPHSAYLSSLFNVTAATMNNRMHQLGIHRGDDSHK